jgi:cbb3-type cytochrome c oxidase subunit III
VKHALPSLLLLTALSQPGCSPPPALSPGIELEPPRGEAAASAAETSAAEPGAAPENRPSDGELPSHINESWWPVRARHLGQSELEVAQRDARIGAARAPAGFWDAQTAVEAVSVWTALCNQCHGGRRRLDDVNGMPEPPADWGQGTGLFFGNRRAYSHLFNVVQNGGPPAEDGRARMPAWRTVLSNEMIWALLYFLEYQSGGIVSRFPPSLYPQAPKLPQR